MSGDINNHDVVACNVNAAAHREGISRNEMVEYYSKWGASGKYDQDLCPGTYNGPKYAAEEVVKTLGKEKLDARILDCAAGTGFLGEELAKRGCVNVDALEPAAGMLAAAKAKKIFVKHIQDYIDDEHNTDIPDGSYDVLAVAGGMGEGHIPCSALKEMIRIVKPGGHIIIVMREEYLQIVKEYKERLEPLMDQLVKDAKWESISRTVVPKYSFLNNGVIYNFRVL